MSPLEDAIGKDFRGKEAPVGGQAVFGTPTALNFDTPYIFYDNFGGPDGLLNGRFPAIGPNQWLATGAQNATMRAGLGQLYNNVSTYSPGLAYAEMNCGQLPGEIGCTFKFNNQITYGISSIGVVGSTATAHTTVNIPAYITGTPNLVISGATGAGSGPCNGSFACTITGANTFTYSVAAGTSSPSGGTINYTTTISPTMASYPVSTAFLTNMLHAATNPIQMIWDMAIASAFPSTFITTAGSWIVNDIAALPWKANNNYMYRMFLSPPFANCFLYDVDNNMTVLFHAQAFYSGMSSITGNYCFFETLDGNMIYTSAWARPATNASYSSRQQGQAFPAGIDSTPIGVNFPAFGCFSALQVGTSFSSGGARFLPRGPMSVVYNAAQWFGTNPSVTSTSTDAGFDIVSATTNVGYGANLNLIDWQGFKITVRNDNSGNFLITDRGGNNIINVPDGGPRFLAGSGAPAFTAPNSSVWLRSDGSTGTRMYINAGGGSTWNAVPGV